MAEIILKNISKKFKKNDNDSIRKFSFLFFGAAALETHRATKELGSGGKNYEFSIDDLSLTIPDGKVMVILGPSGCGKSTLLRLLAGFTAPDSGDILFNNESILHSQPKERQIGMVFQDFALYPHFSVKQNIVSYFFFKNAKTNIEEVARERLEKTSELMGVDIEYLLNRKPRHLSGGEKQRVALGRCITRNPKLFLLDEPFSNLDQKLKEKYRVKLKSLLNHFNITTVYVTHDQQEALILADYVAVMNDGKIEQSGSIEELYNNPRNCFVAEFINIRTDVPSINFITADKINPDWQGFIAGIRPEDHLLQADSSACKIKVSIISVRPVPLKQKSIVTARFEDNELYFEIELNNECTANKEMTVYFKKVFLFDNKTKELHKIVQ